MICWSDLAPDWHFVARPIWEHSLQFELHRAVRQHCDIDKDYFAQSLVSRVNFKRPDYMICWSDLDPDWHFVARPIREHSLQFELHRAVRQHCDIDKDYFAQSLISRVNFKRPDYMICWSDLAPDWHFVARPIREHSLQFELHRAVRQHCDIDKDYFAQSVIN